VGFDLAGAEQCHPPQDFADALAIARDAGVPITLHAGEADAAERVLEAAELGATRIGHGVRLVDWLDSTEGRERLDEVRERGLHLEMCPTSNVNTGAVRSLAEHPMAALWHAGISLSYHTDNPLMSCTTMTAEADVLVRQLGLGRTDLQAMAREAAKRSFLPDTLRAQALSRLGDEAAAH
jgi:adenosine deaminase